MARILIGNIKGPKGDTGARGATGPQGPAGPQGPLAPLTNNFLATVVGQSALDAVAGKTLKDQLDKQNSDLDDTNATVTLKANSIDLKYQIRELNGQDVIILPQGRWCANNGTANNELGYWYVEVVEFDSRYRTITVHPYDGSKKYFYYAKMIEGVWQGWEKYNSVL